MLLAITLVSSIVNYYQPPKFSLPILIFLQFQIPKSVVPPKFGAVWYLATTIQIESLQDPI